MLTSNLTHWISHPEQLNRDSLYELRTLLARYPYCQTLRMLFLKNLYLMHDVSFGSELRKAALFINDRKVLFYLIEGDKFQPLVARQDSENVLEKEHKSESGLDRTLSLIDAFLGSMPVKDNLQVDNLHQISDYTAYLETGDSVVVCESEPETNAGMLRARHLIDSFIEKADSEPMILKPAENEPVLTDEIDQAPDKVVPEEDDDETYFTETLAIIYIKQRRYTKALEIIKKLSLKYPKKNTYFADQIRFLEKLIINANSK